MAVTVQDDYQEHVSNYRSFLHIVRMIVACMFVFLLLLAYFLT